MNQLIPLHSQTINANAIETVNARELHAFLGVNTKFSDWIKSRINEYDFVENQDFVSFSENSEKPNGGRPTVEYYVSIKMAKELSMVERNEKGKQARKYFIECEERLKTNQQSVQPQPLVQPIGEIEDKLRAYAFGMTLLNIDDIAKETYIATAIERVTGIPVPYRPRLEQQTYSATQIGEQLGISANKVGKLANAHNLKTDDYGVWVLDKSASSNKQISNFRYYSNVIPILKAILANE